MVKNNEQVNMKRLNFIFGGMLVFFLVSCKNHCYTFNGMVRGMSFSILEGKKQDVLVLDKTDSVFLAPHYGNYLGIDFYLNDSIDVVYLEPKLSVFRIVSNKYEFREIPHGPNDPDYVFPWGYPQVKQHYFCYGGCDRTFTLFYEGVEELILQPKELKASKRINFYDIFE